MKGFINNHLKAQKGLSLIELMIALLISTILLLGVLELFGSSSKTSRSANASARLQENGRLVMDMIAREARRTGFNGCGHEQNDEQLDFGQGGTIDAFPSESLQGSDDTSVTFRYLGTSDGLKKTDCDKPLDKRFIRFYNDTDSSGKKLIRVASSDTGTTPQALVNHAEIKEILYIKPCTAEPTETCSYKIASAPKLGPLFRDVKKIQVVLELCSDTLSESSNNYCSSDSNTAIRRTFSSLIELRNRQQW